MELPKNELQDSKKHIRECFSIEWVEGVTDKFCIQIMVGQVNVPGSSPGWHFNMYNVTASKIDGGNGLDIPFLPISLNN